MVGDRRLDQMEIDGYPVVRTYVYLGCHLNSSLNLKDHLKEISRKIAYVSWKFYPFRSKLNIKFNNNMLFLISIYENISKG